MLRWLAVIQPVWARLRGFVQKWTGGRTQLSINTPLGYRGERAAADYLRGLGYQIVRHGYTTRDGELDLIALDGAVVVYVEVKTLQRPGSRPEAAVDRRKRQQIVKLAQAFAASQGLLHHRSRFDVIAVVWPNPHEPPEIRHHRHAFRAEPSHRNVFWRDH